MKYNCFNLSLLFLFALVLISSARKIPSAQTHNSKVVEIQKGYHVDGTIGGWGPWINNGYPKHKVDELRVNGRGGGGGGN
ncbi:hypothetical protein Ccrd_015426 [Cynara cardunculus var. scolymus]|uniref:Nodule-specific Glycine Rich Peptide n=1 Tax=Cynara cardunculus var. scolymus TaxID=59895 RepID=A0A103YBX3_CYNCS|nr:hypothetical protein Ccrd_015426 [Cynara cardunculus var. scolymus]